MLGFYGCFDALVLLGYFLGQFSNLAGSALTVLSQLLVLHRGGLEARLIVHEFFGQLFAELFHCY